MASDSTSTCDRCGRRIPPHAHYIVKIEVFADPTMPNFTAEDVLWSDLDAEMADLLKLMRSMSAEELQDQVHRQFQFRLCRPCQMKYLRNPLGIASLESGQAS